MWRAPPEGGSSGDELDGIKYARGCQERISKHEHGIKTAGTIPLDAILSYNIITIT